MKDTTNDRLKDDTRVICLIAAFALFVSMLISTIKYGPEETASVIIFLGGLGAGWAFRDTFVGETKDEQEQV